MCTKPVSPELFAKLEVTVRQFLDQGMPFSAYNITIATRDRERIRLYHRELQGDLMNEGIIHTVCHLRDACELGWTTPQNEQVRWDRSQFNLPDGRWFWVYHPQGYDIAQFKPYTDQQLANIWGTAVAPSPAAAVNPPVNPSPALGSIAVLPAKPDSGGEQVDGTFEVDYRNRLLVPTRFLRDAGLKAGDQVSVITDAHNKLVMLAADSTNFQGSTVKITTQRVERDGDLRLSSATLSPLGSDKFRIENADEKQATIVKVQPI